tara:strand:+ start:4026 stop:5396 length:1371 start_codon:yes stop_codon:yes gene_type:complete
MTITDRPIKISDENDDSSYTILEDEECQFVYNFKYGECSFMIDNSHNGHNGDNFTGHKVSHITQSDETCIKFNDINYSFKSYIITKNIDGYNTEETDTSGNFGIVIYLTSDGPDVLYIQLPFIISNEGEQESDTNAKNLLNIIKNNNDIPDIKINANSWFDDLGEDSIYYYRYNNDNTTIIYVNKEEESYINTLDISGLYFTYSSFSEENTSGTINKCTKKPKFLTNEIEYGDIYIDCSPEDYDKDNPIIKKNMVYSVKPSLTNDSNNKNTDFYNFCVNTIIIIVTISIVLYIKSLIINSKENTSSGQIPILNIFYKYMMMIMGIIICILIAVYMSIVTVDNNKSETIFSSIIMCFIILGTLGYAWYSSDKPNIFINFIIDVMCPTNPEFNYQTIGGFFIYIIIFMFLLYLFTFLMNTNISTGFNDEEQFLFILILSIFLSILMVGYNYVYPYVPT